MLKISNTRIVDISHSAASAHFLIECKHIKICLGAMGLKNGNVHAANSNSHSLDIICNSISFYIYILFFWFFLLSKHGIFQHFKMWPKSPFQPVKMVTKKKMKIKHNNHLGIAIVEVFSHVPTRILGPLKFGATYRNWMHNFWIVTQLNRTPLCIEFQFEWWKILFGCSSEPCESSFVWCWRRPW